jgi:hypothetical protein
MAHPNAEKRAHKKQREAEKAAAVVKTLQDHNQGVERAVWRGTSSRYDNLSLTPEIINNALAPYEAHFINPPDSFVYTKKSRDPQKQIRELTRYVFARYRVPTHLQNVWDKRFNTTRQMYPHQQETELTRTINKIDWYICAAQGGSLYKEHTKAHLTKKETHTFLTCPHELTFEEALTYSIAMTFAEKEGVALRIAKSKLTSRGTSEFIKSVIYFFARNPADSITEIDDLYDFISASRGRNTNFTLAGFTLESLRKRTKDWHYALRREKVMGNSKWAPAPIEDAVYDDKDSAGNEFKWHMVQITTAKELAAEGTAQHHCVSSYRGACAAGKTYIFSLRREDNNGISRKATIELGNDGTIVQARGKANRSTKNDEHRIIQRWADDNGLRLRYYR